MTSSARVKTARFVCAALACSLVAACANTDVAEDADGGLGSSISSATENRYYDNGDGTISDAGTWVLWQQGEGPEGFSWEHANNYCAWLSLNGQGWRLPTIEELKAVVDVSFSPAIDSDAFPGTSAAQFWSSTKLLGSSTFAWNVDFAAAKARADTLNNKLRVRCVRGVARTR